MSSNGLNRAQIFGRIGADPELRFTQGGRAVLNFRVATDESWKDGDGKVQEHTEWHSVVYWGARAEALNKIIGKGSQVLVEGRLRTSSWEKDGQKHWKTEIHGDDIKLGASPKGAGGGGDDRQETRGRDDDRDRRPRDDDRSRDRGRDDDRGRDRRRDAPPPARDGRDEMPY